MRWNGCETGQLDRELTVSGEPVRVWALSEQVLDRLNLWLLFSRGGPNLSPTLFGPLSYSDLHIFVWHWFH